MKIQPVIDYLEAAGLGYLDIGAAAELGEVLENAPRLPALFILPTGETRTGGRETGPVLRQRITYEFSAVSVVRNVAGGTGAAGNDELADLRDGLIGALVAFRHPAGRNNPVPVSGRLAELTDRILIFEDAFRFDGVETREVTS
ncbi:MAG: hypothetical protein TEF_00245 [Rhizobiales bacterium NRL2]|jgi:hypothetical protein|nr:MAG: hypothetical protein TEF_00245 [Rhizobiales bacterium NRL2]